MKPSNFKILPHALKIVCLLERTHNNADPIRQSNHQHYFKSLLITKQSRWQIKSWTLHLPCLMNSLITQAHFWCISATLGSGSRLDTFALTLAKIPPGTCGMNRVRWSWLINTCLISSFYGDGLNYVSIETDFLSDHVIWLNAQETKWNFSASSAGWGVPKGRRLHRREINTAQQHPVQSAQFICCVMPYTRARDAIRTVYMHKAYRVEKQIGLIWDKL